MWDNYRQAAPTGEGGRFPMAGAKNGLRRNLSEKLLVRRHNRMCLKTISQPRHTTIAYIGLGRVPIRDCPRHIARPPVGETRENH
jgi:hypothetical protein